MGKIQKRKERDSYLKRRVLIKNGAGIIAAVSTVFGCCLYPIQASSLEEQMDVVTEEETNQDYAEDTNTPRTRSNHLNYGNVGINEKNNNECYVEGRTQAYHICDKLFLDITLEQKSNGSYNTYKSWSYTGLNVSNLTKGINVLVPKNHYYRVRGYHAAQDSGTKESTTTLTKGVWVGN